MTKTNFNKVLSVVLSFMMLIPILPNMGITVNAAYENTHTNTGDQREDIVAVAKTQVGYHESSLDGTTSGSNNYTKYNVWFGSLEGYGYNYAWCQTFVAWCASQAGISTDVIPKVSGTVSAKTSFQNWGVYHTGPYEGGSYIPKAGDIIYFYSAESDSKHHVGIVSSCDGNTVYTIEGNSSNQVAERSYSVTYGNIRGYGVPNYEGTQPLTTPTISFDKSSYTVGDTVTISWAASNTSLLDHYWLEIYDPNGNCVLNADMKLNTSYNYQVTSAGTYQVYTYATPHNSASGEGSETDYKTFLVKTKPVLSVSAGTSAAETKFSWTECPNAIFYGIRIYDSDKMVINWIEPYNGTSYSELLPEGDYYASVSAIWEDKSFIISEKIPFTVKSIPILSVTAGTPTKETEFNWTACSDAVFYGIRIYDSDKNVLNWIEPYNGTSYSTLLPEGDYYASVASIREDKSFIISEKIPFTVKNVPVLSVTAGTPTKETEFNWTACSDAVFYGIRIYDSDKNVLKWIEPYNGTSYSELRPEGDYYASVASIREDKSFVISEKIPFTVKNIPVLSVTAGTTTKATEFNWTECPNAVFYGIRIYDSDKNVLNWIEPYNETSYSTLLPEGDYYASIAAIWEDKSFRISEKIPFSVSKSDEPCIGDCNADGEFNVADVILLQKWILAVPNTNLPNWQAADLCEDGKLDVFDLVMMKRLLINS